ncbi:hypothetical protein FB567DRAFT_546248 [Paraphoma chrysanthemicola]|uniref:Uncharacterized protein n=1 Tax=Paraphoma chrysanthemicola TaxID=798071 RepID=A0A8K0RDB9_9PLEO|nr:hypothetical protein FB567DRAFT_546248 [Paraphoma chrysanthemicola]
MITTTKANLGRWKDESSGEHLISVKSPWGIIIVGILGIWLSWNTKYIKKIIGNGALWIRIKTLKRKRREHTAGAPVESTPLLTSGGNHPTESTSYETSDSLAKLLKEKSGIRDLVVDCLAGQDLTNRDKCWLAFFTFIVAILATGVIIGGYFAANVRVDGPAILASDRCGLWLYDSDKRSEAATRARMLDLEKEERASQFAEDYYGEANAVAFRCKVLHRPTLPMSDPVYSNDCPFYKDICRLNQTVTFTTPLIDAKELGFNTPVSPKFRRSTACTPLSMEYPFIQNQTVDGITTYTYHYGTKRTGNDGIHTINHTYTTSGDPWERDAPVYDLFAYSYSNGSDRPVWTPHEYLMRGKYSSITIIFVSSLRIYYEEYSTDPIFPADKMVALPGDTRSWFRNSDPRAQPLACMDTTEVCTDDGKSCWDINTPDKEKTVSDNATEFYLLYAALYKTDTYYSFAKRQGRSLIAQKKVSQYFSLALGTNAWVDEVENWVRTSLARTSINAWSVASGEDSVHEGEDGWRTTIRTPSSPDVPPSRNSEQRPEETGGQAQAGPSRARTAATPPTEQEEIQNAGLRRSSSSSEQGVIEWEPLVLHMLLYGFWLLISRSLLGVKTFLIVQDRPRRGKQMAALDGTGRLGSSQFCQPPVPHFDLNGLSKLTGAARQAVGYECGFVSGGPAAADQRG